MKTYRYKVEMYNHIDLTVEYFYVNAYSAQDAFAQVETKLTEECWEDMHDWSRKKVTRIS